jgi:hypothetical protein
MTPTKTLLLVEDEALVQVYISGHGSADWPSKGVPNSLTLGKPFATAQLIEVDPGFGTSR